MTKVSFLLCFLHTRLDLACLKSYQTEITIWMKTNKRRKYVNVSSTIQEIFIADKIKTQCDKRPLLRASGEWTAFLLWLLNFLSCRPFLLLLDCHCSTVVIHNGLGVCVPCLQLHAPLIPVLPSEQAWTTHPFPSLLTRNAGNISYRPVWENQAILNAWLPVKAQRNPNGNCWTCHS